VSGHSNNPFNSASQQTTLFYTPMKINVHEDLQNMLFWIKASSSWPHFKAQVC